MQYYIQDTFMGKMPDKWGKTSAEIPQTRLPAWLTWNLIYYLIHSSCGTNMDLHFGGDS